MERFVERVHEAEGPAVAVRGGRLLERLVRRVDRGSEQVRRGLIRRAAELHRLVELRDDLRPDRFDARLVGDLDLLELALDALDGIALHPGRVLLLAPRIADVGPHRVSAPAIGHRLDEGGAFAGAGAFDRLAHRLVDLHHVVAVDGAAGDPVRHRALRHLVHRGRVAEGRRERVLVVLADEDEGQLPHRGEVERFVEDALVRGAVAEEGDRDPARAVETGGETRPGREGHRGPDDAVRAEDVEPEIRDVHRAPEPLAVAGLAAHELGHHEVEPRPLGDAVAVPAVVARHEVLGPQARADPRRDRLLPHVAVRGALDLATGEELRDLLVEGADAAHRPVEIDVKVGRQAQVGLLRLGAGPGLLHVLGHARSPLREVLTLAGLGRTAGRAREWLRTGVIDTA